MNHDRIRLAVLELTDALAQSGAIARQEELEWLRSRLLDVQQWNLTLKRFKAESMERHTNS